MFPEDVASECYTTPCCRTDARLLQTDNRGRAAVAHMQTVQASLPQSGERRCHKGRVIKVPELFEQDGGVLPIPNLSRQVDCGYQAETVAEAISLVDATASGRCSAFFAGAFFVTGFFAWAFLTAAFFAGAGFVTALTFFATAFLAATFVPATFLVAAFFTAALVAGADFEVDDTSSAAAIRNFERSLAPASHAGVRPRPLHVAPLLGSRYFGAWGPRT